MNLPFSPTFFRKIDIFQQIIEYESQRTEKRLWEGEKAVLIWGGSEHHQHLGSAINEVHVKDALEYCVNADYIKRQEMERLLGSLTYILQCLITHEYGEPVSNPADKVDLRINKNGILAGQILRETNNLKKTKKYRIWFYEWWLLYYCAGIILIFQMLKIFIELIEKLL